MRKLTAVAAMLLVFAVSCGTAQAKSISVPKVYEVCSVNVNTQTSALVQEIKTSDKVYLSAQAVGPITTTYYAVYELNMATTCSTLFNESQSPGPYPPGTNLEADTSHKPYLT